MRHRSFSVASTGMSVDEGSGSGNVVAVVAFAGDSREQATAEG
ncbi:hypothetical protein [Corynebacterium sputi]|nr:hypothetical protein [Corynebacterium sputi]